MVTWSRINLFQTQFLIIIKWPNLGHETRATLPFHMWSSLFHVLLKTAHNHLCRWNSRNQLSGSVVCCCCSFAGDVTKSYLLHYWNNYGMEGFLPLNSTPMVCRFLFRIYWNLISISSKVFCHMIASIKTECVAFALTNFRWHCSHGHTTMTSQRVGVHSFESRPNEAVIWGSLFGETITRTNTQAWPHVWIVFGQI